MEKKSQITIGGEVAEEITVVDNPRRSSVPAPLGNLSPSPADIAYHEATSAVFARSAAAPLSPEHAQALRQVNHEPEPIPEGALYHVRAYSETGEPASDALLDKLLGGGTATNLAAPMTHAEAVTMCLDVNKKIEAADAPIWLGVFGVDEAGEAS